MTAPHWQEWPEDCETCDEPLEVYTTENANDGFFNDGDAIRCLTCEITGTINVIYDDCIEYDWGGK